MQAGRGQVSEGRPRQIWGRTGRSAFDVGQGHVWWNQDVCRSGLGQVQKGMARVLHR